MFSPPPQQKGSDFPSRCNGEDAATSSRGRGGVAGCHAGCLVALLNRGFAIRSQRSVISKYSFYWPVTP